MKMILTETEKEVQKVLEDRWKFGRAKYGQGINFDLKENPADWLTEAIEEVADQLQYLVAFKLHLKKLEEQK